MCVGLYTTDRIVHCPDGNAQ